MDTNKLLRSAKLLFAFLLLGSAFTPFTLGGEGDGEPPPPYPNSGPGWPDDGTDGEGDGDPPPPEH